MNNDNKIHKEVSKIKNKIYKVLPNVNEVDINIVKKEDGLYESLIKVHVPKKKELIASKRGATIKKCLDKSHQAITRQIHRVKSKSYQNRLKYYNLDMST